jgi:hypothetical protein
VGIPIHVVKGKMTQEKLDTSVIDKDASEMIPLEGKKGEDAKAAPKGGLAGLAGLKGGLAGLGAKKAGGAAKAPAEPKGPRKKKLHWKAISKNNIAADR